MDIQALDRLALEMGAAALLIDAAGAAETLALADLAPGLHATLRRWVDTIEAVSASARATDEQTEILAVELTPDEAASLRARAAAHGVTPEVEVAALIESAIQRQAARWEP